MNKKLMSIATSMMLLKLLENGDMYGYQMIKELEERSENVFEMNEGTIYPILHGLEASGKIISYSKVSENGRKRKYYEITPEGRNELKKKHKEWDTYRTAVGKIMGETLC